MYHLVKPAAVNNYYVAGYRLKLNHVCRELYEIFGPDNPIDELLSLSRGEMSDTARLVGPDIHLPNITHLLVDAMPLLELHGVPLVDGMPLVDVMVRMSSLFQAFL
jgi:hypothetical protein